MIRRIVIKLTCGFCIVAYLHLCTAATLASIASHSFITLTDQNDRHESLGPHYAIVRSEAEFLALSAHGSADTNFELSTFAESQFGSFAQTVYSNSTFAWTYGIDGNPSGVPIPAILNFRLDGQLTASSEKYTQAVSTVTFSLGATGSGTISGQMSLPTAQGIPPVPVLVGRALLFDPVYFPLENRIMVDETISMPLSSNVGLIIGSLTSGANAGLGLETKATSDFSNTFRLESITVPWDFDAVNVDDLRVVFSSGLSMPITREAVVPEPGAFSMWLIWCMILGFRYVPRTVSRREKKRGEA